MSENEIEQLFNRAVSENYVRALVEKYNDGDVVEDILCEALDVCKLVLGRFYEAEGINYAGNRVFYHC